MKHNLSFFLAALMIFTITSCKKNNLVVDKDPISPPSFSEFALTGDAATSKRVAYFVTDDPASEVKIPVGITTVANTARRIDFTYSSSTAAVAGTQYNAPASIVIPAGEALDTLRIQGLFSGYPSGR